MSASEKTLAIRAILAYAQRQYDALPHFCIRLHQADLAQKRK